MADKIRVERLTPDAALEGIAVVRALYAEVYVEPPYREGPADVEKFVAGWPRRVSQPGFTLVLAFDDPEPVGFTFGHQLSPDTRWWEGALTPLAPEITREWPGRTVAIIELAVRQRYRRQGIGRALHDALVADHDEERVTLLARPELEAEPARLAYRSWGYQKIGQIRPFSDGPSYDALIADLPGLRSSGIRH